MGYNPKVSVCVAVGLAHGSLRNRLNPAAETHNMIEESRASDAELDYLALGDWHSMTEIAAKAWYSGTPERDDFHQESGYVLAVEIAALGATPVVEPIRVGRYTWQQIEATHLCIGQRDPADELELARREAGPIDAAAPHYAGNR